jgi:predicted PurR-regulated permease PerM
VTAWPANCLSSRRIAAALVLGLTFWLIRSFMIPLIWAAVFAIANWPLYRRCAQYVPAAMRAHLLPLAFSLVITLLVLGPIVFAFAILARQSQAWLTEISIMDKGGLLAPSWLRATPMVGARLADAWNDAAGVPGGLSALLGRVEDSSLLRSLQSVGHLIAYHAFVVAITVVALVFFFRRGEELAKALAHRIDEQFGRLGAKFVEVAAAALRATVQSMVLVGLIDGIAMGIIYATVHIPSPIAWGAVTGILAMLPFIGYSAIAAVCVSQLAHDATASALLVGAVGFVVLFSIDKFVRPMLMAKGARLDFLGALMGTVGGLQTFGLLGIFIGPMIVAVGKAILDEWLTHSRPVPGGPTRFSPPDGGLPHPGHSRTLQA